MNLQDFELNVLAQFNFLVYPEPSTIIRYPLDNVKCNANESEKVSFLHIISSYLEANLTNDKYKTLLN